MTFQEIVTEVAARLNLTSPDAMARIGREVNARHRRVTSAVGLDISRRVLDMVGVGVMGESTVTFTGLAKIERVFDTRGGTIKILNEITFDEMRGTALRPDDSPTLYAIQTMTASSIVVAINAVIKTVYDLKADGLASSAVLSGAMVPSVPDDFHDILIEGTCADELRKMEKLTDAKTAEALAEYRLSELRLFIAKSAYLTRRQGGRAGGRSGAGGSRQTEGGGGGVPGDLDIHQTGLITFDRDPNAPFAVTPGSAPVSNLIAEGAIYVVNLETDTLVGRDTPGTGNSEHITLAGGLEFTGTLGFRRSALTGEVTAPAGSGVTTIAAAVVTTPKLADGSVTTPKLADGAVTTQKIGDGQVTNAKLAPNAITADKIADLNVGTADLADLSVTTPKLDNLAVTQGKIAPSAVGPSQLAVSAVETAHILDLNVTTPKLADGAVTTPKLAAGAVTGDKIAAGTIPLDKLPSMAVSRLLGRGGAAGAGAPEEILLGTNLSMSGTTLNATGGSGGGGGDVVTNVNADRLIGRDTPGVGNSEQLIVTEGLAFTGAGGIGIANNGVTYAKLQDVSGPSRLLGRGASSAGDPEEIVLGPTLAMSGTTLNVTASAPVGHHAQHEPGGSDALVNAAWTHLVNTFTGSWQSLRTVNPQLHFWDTVQPANARVWRIMHAGQVLSFGLLDDALAIEQARPMQLSRTGDLTLTGAMYAPLGLGATPLNASNLTSGAIPDARLSANVALKNIDNHFVKQTLADETTITGTAGVLYLFASAAPGDARLWRTVNYADGALRFEAVNDVVSLVQGSIQFSRAGQITAAGLGSTPLNADNLTSGTVPVARLPLHATRHNAGGADPLTAINGAIITTGTVADARLSTNVALKNLDNFFVSQSLSDGSGIVGPNGIFNLRSTGSAVDQRHWRMMNYGDGVLSLDAVNDAISAVQGTIKFLRTGALQAAGLSTTPLNADQITSGTVPDARLSANVAFRNIDNNFVTQTLGTDSKVSGPYSVFSLIDTAAPTGQRRWRMLNYNNGTLSVESTNDAGTVVATRPLLLTPDGTVVLEHGRLKFGAPGNSADPNTLDHYAEGNWTPILDSTNGYSGLTYNWQLGNFVKVGRLVTVTFDIYIASPGTATGELLINGLPYRASNSYYVNGVGAISAWTLTTDWYCITANCLQHAWNFALYVLSPGSRSVVAMTPAFITTGSRLFGTVSYFADS